jgi:hypothetical protein
MEINPDEIYYNISLEKYKNNIENGINIYSSFPDGKPVNKRDNFYILKGNTPINDSLNELKNYHKINFENYTLPIENIPEHITHISITGKKYNFQLDNLPSNLVYLELCTLDSYDYELTNLPLNLKELHVSMCLQYPITSFPNGLLKLYADFRKLKEDVNIDMPQSLIIFDVTLNTFKQITTVSPNLKLFEVEISNKYENVDKLNVLDFNEGLEIFSVTTYNHGLNEISIEQIEKLPDSVKYMQIQINDDSRYIKFPKSLEVLELDNFSFIQYETCLRSMNNIKAIHMSLAQIMLLDINNIPKTLKYINFNVQEHNISNSVYIKNSKIHNLVMTHTEFIKYKTLYEKALYNLQPEHNSRKRKFSDTDLATDIEIVLDDNEEYSDDEILYENFDYTDGDYSGKKHDTPEMLKIKQLIIRKYVDFIVNTLTSNGVYVDYS